METIQGESMFPPVKCDCHDLLNCPSKWMGDRMVKLTAHCKEDMGGCGESVDTVLVSMADYDKYLAGGLVQDVWPTMPAQDREVIVSSRAGFYLCSNCWNQLSSDRLWHPEQIESEQYWERRT